MDKINPEEAMKELTLMLMYLSRFTGEKDFYNAQYYSTWKGYSFHVINELVDNEYVFDGKHPSRTKSVTFSEKGLAEAQKLLEKYHIDNWKK